MVIPLLCKVGIFGKGLFKGPYTQAGAVPVSESDMIFTVIGEELGVLGCIAAITLIGLVIFRIIRDAKTAIAGPAQYIGFGIASMIAVGTLVFLLCSILFAYLFMLL